MAARGAGAIGRRVRIQEGLLSRAIATGAPEIDLYADILPAMAHRELLHHVDWRGGLDFSVAIIPSSPFLHIGSSRELLDTLTGAPPPVSGWTTPPAGTPSARVYNTRLDETAAAALGRRVIIEACHLRAAPSLAGSNILVGVPRGLAARIVLPEGWGMVCLPVGEGSQWVACCFGEGDDFKTPLTRGGTLGNRPLQHLLETAGLTADELWPGLPEPQRTLWTARLWTPTEADAMLEPVAWMLAGARPPEHWGASRRLSAAEVMATVDHARLLDARGRVTGRG